MKPVDEPQVASALAGFQELAAGMGDPKTRAAPAGSCARWARPSHRLR